VLVRRFTEDHRQELLRRGEESLWFFITGILGFDDYDEGLKASTLSKFHEDLCLFLEGKLCGPWRKALICAFRGAGKSTFCRGRLLQNCLYRVNYAGKIMCNSSDNARDIHFLPLMRVLSEGQRADFLSGWLFAHRIPEGFAGWNSEQMVLNRTNPLAEVAITYWGIESKKEGSHPDGIWFDDLEGAEAEKSSAANKASWQAWVTMPPLLRDRRTSQIWGSGTPWGNQPLVWAIRDDEPGDLDNSQRTVKLFWAPLVGESGNADEPSPWPIRFPPSVVREMLAEPVADQQYLLKRANSRADLFDLDAAANFYYAKDAFEQGVFRYETMEFDPDKLNEKGMAQGNRRPASVQLADLRFFVHVDPLQRPTPMRKTTGGQRPAEFAVLVTGVAPDGHVFVIETWTMKGPDLNVQADHVFRYYRKYAPHLVTFESVGAQVWFLSYVLKREQDNSLWGRPTSTPGVVPVMDLPRLSSRFIEAEKVNQTKEYLYRERLAPWLNSGLLHLHKAQTALIYQLQHALDETCEVDLLDCLVQGAGRVLTVDLQGKRRHDHGKLVWSRPIGREVREALHQQEAVQERRRDRRTGYASPWR
jgi:hypothetical protein